MNLLSSKDAFCRPAGTATAFVAMCAGFESLHTTGVDHRPNLISGAACVGSRILRTITSGADLVIVGRNQQPVRAANRP